ncbi:hypothetical protein [uncultured Catenibacterium sp.]|uniref:hypothetical protein n=1 Tax=uncultured Catenibacterium sp. TaxID=286142 RepID=UPI0025E98BC4|nr:hypothetical protein [uncultured Catenibacterium sp.]
MLSSKEKKFIICFVIYVALFIASAFYPDQTVLCFNLGSIPITIYSLPTIFCSNLILPFIGNTLLLIYFFKDDIKNFFKI